MTRSTTHTPTHNPTTKPASTNNNVQIAKADDLTKVAKHPPEQPTTAAKHLPGATTAAKHPLDRNGGKASASEENPTTKRDPNDADEMRRRQA